MPLRPRSPYTQGAGRFDSEYGGPRDFDINVNELVRKTNLAVALTNSQVSARAKFTLLHPMMSGTGRYPEDFNVPKTVETVKLFDSKSQLNIETLFQFSYSVDTQLDRILQFYGLPYDKTALLAYRRDTAGGGRQVRQEKLQVLFEYLGATRIVEYGDLLRRPWA